MSTLLLPCDGSSHSLLAVQHVIDAVRTGADHRIHLVNVQPPFSAHIAHHVDHETRMEYHREQADLALAKARELLDAAGVPYHVHAEVGDKASCVADLALRLRCDLIVLGTAPKNRLLRAIENSLTSQLLEHSPVPVEVITADSVGVRERLGITAMGCR
jgi:nucleotide-binding universal stress UspA family protein